MKPPAAPGIDTRPVRTGTTRITTYPNKSLHLKSSTILNSNLYEPAEPNPMTPNLPNERPGNERPGNERPPHERPPNEHPPNENSPYEHHLPAKTRQSAKQARAKRPPAKPNFPNHTPTEAGLFPPRRPTRRGHRVPYTRFGGSGPGQNTGPRSHPYPPILDFPQHMRGRNKYGATHPLKRVCGNIRYLHCPISDSTNAQTRSKAKHGTAPPPIPPTLDFPQQRNTKQIRCHTPAEAGYHTIDTACDIPPL
ncbi:hypothetical protein BS47DRAFT_1362667 [Hydnum rufescens UP504]|uniref:Uncharacterized protein n=1 Tax=Hydnum rufescens UP504 TaxID=1448309 RepID=A0A9P6AW76_9AGAM|nr:hypothetical protein BS47DRAFT_1362667 [Hydnum rufescens UP504]